MNIGSNSFEGCTSLQIVAFYPLARCSSKYNGAYFPSSVEKIVFIGNILLLRFSSKLFLPGTIKTIEFKNYVGEISEETKIQIFFSTDFQI